MDRQEREERDKLIKRQKKKSLTFLAVNDKVALLISGRDSIRDPIPIGVLCQHCGYKCVGARIL